MPSGALLLTDLEKQHLRSEYGEKFVKTYLKNTFTQIFIEQILRNDLKHLKKGEEVSLPVSTCDRYLKEIYAAFESECPELVKCQFTGKHKILSEYLKKKCAEEKIIIDDEINSDIKERLKKYAKYLKNSYGYLKLESLGSSDYRHTVKMPIEKIFVPQTLRESPPLLDISPDLASELEASGHIDKDYLNDIEQRKADYDKLPICNAIECINNSEFKQAVITGDPGSGKSTLVHYIAVVWAETWHTSNLPIPLIIELRKYINDLNQVGFLEYLHKGSNSVCKETFDRSQLETSLENGIAFVIFDGLDEVFDPILRETIVAEIIKFTTDYPKVKILVTSRKIGYLGEPFRHAEFREFAIEDLSDEQISNFSNRWHQLTFSNALVESEKYQSKLSRAIAESPAIHQLAKNPLLLTMMALLNRYRELPRKRYELYKSASELLLSNWDVKRQIKDENLLPEMIVEHKRKILQNVAYSMQSREGNLISRANLIDIFVQYLQQQNIEPLQSYSLTSRIINQLRERNFILCLYGGETYGFIHRTFLEFFCASEFIHQFEIEKKITINYICEEILGVYWQKSTWHEVLRLFAGRLKEELVAKMIRYLIDIPIDFQLHRNDFHQLKKSGIENLLFAAELLHEVQYRCAIAETDNALLEALKALTDQDLDVSSNLALTDIFERVWKDDHALHEWLNSVPEGLINFNELDDLSSDRGVDYRHLRDSLRARDWEAADIETNRIMCEVGGKVAEGYLNKSDLESFPCTDLKTINRLWTKYSAGKLGFTTQNQIWLRIGGKSLAEYNNRKEEYSSFLRFSQSVGWFADKILMHEQIYQQKYRLKNSGLHPLVHKPLGYSTIRGFRFSSIFFPRAEACGI